MIEDKLCILTFFWSYLTIFLSCRFSRKRSFIMNDLFQYSTYSYYASCEPILQHDGLYTGNLTEVGQNIVNVFSVAQYGILIGPVFQQGINVAFSGNKCVRPEGNATLKTSFFNFGLIRFLDGTSCHSQFNLPVISAESSKNTFSLFSNAMNG